MAPPLSVFRDDILHGQVALISGGGSGIGFEIARQLGLHGACVVICGRRVNVLEAAVAKLTAEGVNAGYARTDVRNYDTCQFAVAETVRLFGRLTILVNNAAGNFLAAAEDLSPGGFRSVMEIDAFGAFHMATASFQELKRSYCEVGDASIINITATFEHPPFYQMHAAAAKMAINSMTKSMALEWADYGIRSNGIAPGPIADTVGMSKLGGMGGSDPNAGQPREDLPRGLKLGLTWDIGMAAVFISSPAGQYISGDTLNVDGGSYLRTGLARKADGSLDVNRGLIQQLSKSREKQQKTSATGVAGAKAKL